MNFNELGVRQNGESTGGTTGCPGRWLPWLHRPVHTLTPQSCQELAACSGHWDELPWDCGLCPDRGRLMEPPGTLSLCRMELPQCPVIGESLGDPSAPGAAQLTILCCRDASPGHVVHAASPRYSLTNLRLSYLTRQWPLGEYRWNLH